MLHLVDELVDVVVHAAHGFNVLLVLALPLTSRACLMLHHDALLKLGIEISTAIAAVHWDQQRVKLLARVLLGLENVVRDPSLIVEKCHFFLLL